MQEAISPQVAGKPIPGQDPVEFVFYLDENCEHATEVLVHSWLDLHECSIETCLVGELLVGQSQNGQAALPARMQEEINTTKPVDILQVRHDLSAVAQCPAKPCLLMMANEHNNSGNMSMQDRFGALQILSLC